MEEHHALVPIGNSLGITIKNKILEQYDIIKGDLIIIDWNKVKIIRKNRNYEEKHNDFIKQK